MLPTRDAHSGCCNAAPRVTEVFVLTDLHTILDLHQHEGDAIGHFFRDVA